MSNEQAVKDVYAAFQRGDVAAIVTRVSDDVRWKNDTVQSRECPWNGDFSGKTNVPRFFEVVAEQLDITVFDVRKIMVNGTSVAVSLHIESTVRKNGRPLQNDAMHLWTFNDRGQIASYQHFNDTAAELAAWRG